jgi:hypothetical protein
MALDVVGCGGREDDDFDERDAGWAFGGVIQV